MLYRASEHSVGTLFCFLKARQAACSGVELEGIVTSGEDSISTTRIALMFTSCSSSSRANTFLTISRSVTKPIGLLYLSTTTVNSCSCLSFSLLPV